MRGRNGFAIELARAGGRVHQARFCPQVADHVFCWPQEHVLELEVDYADACRAFIALARALGGVCAATHFVTDMSCAVWWTRPDYLVTTFLVGPPRWVAEQYKAARAEPSSVIHQIARSDQLPEVTRRSDARRPDVEDATPLLVNETHARGEAELGGVIGQIMEALADREAAARDEATRMLEDLHGAKWV